MLVCCCTIQVELLGLTCCELCIIIAETYTATEQPNAPYLINLLLIIQECAPCKIRTNHFKKLMTDEEVTWEIVVLEWTEHFLFVKVWLCMRVKCFCFGRVMSLGFFFFFQQKQNQVADLKYYRCSQYWGTLSALQCDFFKVCTGTFHKSYFLSESQHMCICLIS